MKLIRKSWLPEALKLNFKAAGDGPGGFEGYGAVYGNVDRDTEIIAKGAFADSLPAFVRDGFIAEAHEWECGVATVLDAREDDYGLFLSAQFHTDSDSQSVRVRTMERIERGKSVGLSVGFMPIEWSWDEQSGVRTITKADLYEVSIVTVPANPMAQVIAAKSAGHLPATVRDFEAILRDAGYSRKAATLIASKGFAAYQREAGEDENRPALSADLDELAAIEAQFLLTQARLLGVAA